MNPWKVARASCCGALGVAPPGVGWIHISSEGRNVRQELHAWFGWTDRHVKQLA